MFQRLILGTVLVLIPSVISSLIVEDDLFEAHLQRLARSLETEAGSGSGQEVEVEGESGSGSGVELTTCEDSLFGCCPDSWLPAHGPHHVGCCLEAGDAQCCPDYQRSQTAGEDCGCESSRFGCCPDGVTARWTEEDGGKYPLNTSGLSGLSQNCSRLWLQTHNIRLLSGSVQHRHRPGL